MSKTITNATTENAIEIEADTPAAVEPDTSEEMPAEIDPIEEQFTGDCPSISGRSTLTYAIGRHKETGELAPAHHWTTAARACGSMAGLRPRTSMPSSKGQAS